MKKAGFDTSMLEGFDLEEACQKGYMTHPTRKTKIMFGKRYRNCVKKEGVDTTMTMEQAGMIADNICVNCGDFANENLRKWFSDRWVNIGKKKKGGGHPPCGTSGKKRGYAKCVPASKARSMSKKDKTSATRRKRRAQNKANRGGKASKGQGKKPIMTKTEARGTCWVGYKQVGMKKKGNRMVPNCVKEEVDIYYEENGKGYGYTFEFITDKNLQEAEYQGRKVKLNKIMQGDAKKFKVYVKNPKGNVVKVNFGQGGDAKGGTMRIRKSNPKARKNFRARHNCDNPGPKHKARYWACRTW